MVDATISCVRVRDLTGLGRSRAHVGRATAAAAACAARRRTATDASSIAGGTPPRPRAASSRPGVDDLMASTI
jgi:hypothetical protein